LTTKDIVIKLKSLPKQVIFTARFMIMPEMT